MASKEQMIVAEPGSSPVSLSMCFEQAFASADPTLNVDSPTESTVNIEAPKTPPTA